MPQARSDYRWSLTHVDISEPAGAALWAAIKPAKLPAAVLSQAVADEIDPLEGSLRVAQQLGNGFALSTKVGGGLALSTGDWNPECADATGCATSACAGDPACRPEIPRRLDLFVVALCPYTKASLAALDAVIKNFEASGASLVTEVHYIGTDEGAGVLTSPGGPFAVAESRTSLCVQKHGAPGLRPFLECRASGDYLSRWEACTGGATGIATTPVAHCIANPLEGDAMVRDSFVESEALRIDWSPTWVVNGKFRHHGIDAETVKTAVCDHNKMPGCSVRLGRVQPRKKWLVRGASSSAP